MKLFERSELTKSLVNFLRLFDKGKELTYKDIGKAVSESINSSSHHLRYARLILEREHNQIWIAVRPNVGIRRLNDTEIAERLPEWWLNGARRKLSRGGDQAEVVEVSALNIDEQNRFAVSGVQRELAMQSLAKATARKLAKTARGTSNDLPSFNILEWAINLMPRKETKPSP